MASNGFTPTEQRIIDVLNDGQPHSRHELRDLLDDELAGPNALNMHLTNIRRKLPGGLVIACIYRRQAIWFQQFRQLTNPYDGRS